MSKEAAGAILLLGLTIHPCLADAPDAEALRKKIADIKRQPEQKWQRIPWVSSLTEARRLSEKERRPVFLFTYDGNLDIGRC